MQGTRLNRETVSALMMGALLGMQRSVERPINDPPYIPTPDREEWSRERKRGKYEISESSKAVVPYHGVPPTTPSTKRTHRRLRHREGV